MFDLLFREFRKEILLLTMPAFLFAGVAEAQQPSPARRTPLGTPSPFPIDALKEAQRGKTAAPTIPLEPLNQAVERVATAHGGRQALKNIAAVQAEGTLTVFEATGASKSYPLTLLAKGEGQIQRVIRQPSGQQLKQGTDGNRTWDGVAGHLALAVGSTLSFIEAQTTRSVRSFIDYAARGSRPRDAGMKGPDRAIEIEEANGRTTTYFFDVGSGRVARTEFVTTTARDMFSGKAVPSVETYEFSDYRMIQGVLTPLKVTHLADGVKRDEAQFSTFRYNDPVSIDDFRP